MKRGTTPVLPVAIELDASMIESVTFVFKSEFLENAPAKLTKRYPDEVAYEDGAFLVPFTEEETRLFNGQFFMDTRIVTVSGSIPETAVCKLYMNPTLFSVKEVAG